MSGSLAVELAYSRFNKPDSEGEFMIETFSDASIAPQADSRLISGMAIYVNRNLVGWLSKKQKNIIKSTAAAELVALSIAEDRTMHVRSLIMDLGFTVVSTKLLEDNTAVIACCKNKSLSHTRKMVDVKMKAIRERLSTGVYELDYVNTELNVADLFTKALLIVKFNAMLPRLFQAAIPEN